MENDHIADPRPVSKKSRKMGIKNKILGLVLTIFVLFTLGISFVIGFTSFNNLTSITIGQLDRMSRILSNRLTEIEKNAVRIVQDFEYNHRILDHIIRITNMGPYYTIDPLLSWQKIEDSEKIYMFQAQMDLIPILRSLQNLNDLSSISFYLSSPFDIVPKAEPVLSIRINSDAIYLGHFGTKGNSKDRGYLQIPVKQFRPIPSDYFDISSVYSITPDTFYKESGFKQFTGSIDNEVLKNTKSRLNSPVSKMLVKNGTPIIQTWYSVIAPLPEQNSYIEKMVVTGLIMVEQRFDQSKMTKLKSELGIDLGISFNDALLTGTLWQENQEPSITIQKTVSFNENTYYYSKKEILFSSGSSSGFHALVFSPVSILTTLTGELFLKILFAGFIAMCLMGGVIYLAFRKLLNRPLGDLMDGVRMLSAGELNHKVMVYSEDELGQLAKAFNKMTQTLLNITDDLKKTVNKLNKAQSYVKNIINSMPSVLIGVDETSKVTQWNRQAEIETGLPAKKAKDRYLTEVFPRLSSEIEKIQMAMIEQQALVDTKVVHEIEGVAHYEDITIYPLTTNGEEGAVIRIDDVTEHVRLEEIMIQSEKMLSVGGLAAGMAHEINNPLAGMMQNASALINRLTSDLPANDETAAECGTDMVSIQSFLEKRGVFQQLQLIHKSGIRAANIVDNMLNFARKSDTKPASNNICDLLDKTVKLAENDYNLKKKYDFRQIEIVREYEPNMPSVLCEASKIQQVFLNLLKNGAEAMSEKQEKNGRSRFVLRIINTGNMALIEVENNGPAMNETTRKRVFEPFFTTKSVGVGTGLGLSVSYFIITENHGGRMSVESTTNKGTKFIIYLPFKR